MDDTCEGSARPEPCGVNDADDAHAPFGGFTRIALDGEFAALDNLVHFVPFLLLDLDEVSGFSGLFGDFEHLIHICELFDGKSV